MQIILLPGSSAANAVWSRNLANQLEPRFDGCRIQSYGHWATGEKHLDLQRELDRAVHAVSELTDYIILAKSAGSILALKGMYESKLKPTACVFVGCAVYSARQAGMGDDLEMWLTSMNVPSLFIHNRYDTVIPAPELKSLLEALHVKNYRFHELPGDNHSYDEATIGHMVEDFIFRMSPE